MQLDDYVKLGRGKQMHLAKAINAQPQLVYQWANGIRPVPIERCVAIERATGGVVTRKDLRPSDWWKIWPELEGTSADFALRQMRELDAQVAAGDVDAGQQAVGQKDGGVR